MFMYIKATFTIILTVWEAQVNKMSLWPPPIVNLTRKMYVFILKYIETTMFSLFRNSNERSGGHQSWCNIRLEKQ